MGVFDERSAVNILSYVVSAVSEAGISAALKIAGITQVSLGNERNVIYLLFSVQELTEEGLPFLILFHMKDDLESLEKFQQEVARQLISEKGLYQLVTAGTVFFFFQVSSIWSESKCLSPRFVFVFFYFLTVKIDPSRKD